MSDLQIKILTLDTETLGLGGAIKRIAIYDGEQVRYGYTFEDIEPYILQYFDNGYFPHIYVHNLEFDLRKMPKVFEQGNVMWNKTKAINNRFARLCCLKYTFHDSFKILPESLDSLSKSFGLEHGKLDLWDEVQKTYSNQYTSKVDYFMRCDKDDPLYIKYLGYDVISLYELIYKLMEISGLSETEFIKILSTASLSKYIFKNGYKGKQFITEGQESTDYEIMCSFSAWTSNKKLKGFDISYADIENKLRETYCGGRTEVFKPISGKAYYYDVNSLYPYVMSINRFPIGFPNYFNNHFAISKMFKNWQRYKIGLGFIKAKVYIPKQNIPPLPVKKGKLIFPCGYVVGFWTYSELDYAVRECGVEIIEFLECIHFPKTFPIFKNFISVFSEMKSKAKENGEKALEKFAKLVQNTGYGYTGMRRDDKDEFRDISYLEKYIDDEKYLYSNDQYGYIKIKSNVFSDSIQVQVASYVTSYARLVLLKGLKEQEKKGEVYYCDTDSIICSAEMPAEWVHHSALGKFDLEKQVAEGIYIQPKVYYVKEIDEHETFKFKGVSKETQKTFTADFYKNLLGRLADGEMGKILVEENKELLRSITYQFKVGGDLNAVELRNKELNLANKQKRNMDYIYNKTEPIYFDSFECFDNFTFLSKPTHDTIQALGGRQ